MQIYIYKFTQKLIVGKLDSRKTATEKHQTYLRKCYMTNTVQYSAIWYSIL